MPMFKSRFIFILILVSALVALPSFGQQLVAQTPQPVQRDTQAMTVLAQVLNAAGGAKALGAIQDYTASGTATFYWGGKQEQGTVAIKGRGIGQFSISAALSEGGYKFVAGNGTGSVVRPDGDRRLVEYGNTINFGSLTFPLAYLTTAVLDSSTSVTYVGLETSDGAQVYHIQIKKVPLAQNDLANFAAKLSTRDFFIDSTTLQVVSALDMVHPKDQSARDIPHKMKFSNYSAVNGVLVPFSVDEFVYGQHTWSIQLSQISFNGGLTDSDFQP